jgi:hypothetical protein
MEAYVGVWIDHEQAFIVTLQKGRQDLIHVESNVEGHVRLSGGSRTASPWGPTDVAPEGRPERRRVHHLRRFYQDIVRRIERADRVYVFGPGEAKLEFVKEMRKTKALARRIAAVEPADRMTERQVVAKVRAFFAGDRACLGSQESR